MYNQFNDAGMYNMGGYNSFPKKTFNWNSVLNNTQRTLGIINQAIPIVYQLKPLVSNARTVFKIAGALNKSDNVDSKQTNYETPNNYTNYEDSNDIKFFL